MSAPGLVLITPEPIDGYPPVQHQATLLARAGYAVHVVTLRLAWRDGVEFAAPGVTLHIVPGTSVATPAGAARFAVRLLAVRLRARPAAEIAYEPIGQYFAARVPFAPRTRIAHFHEVVQDDETAPVRRRALPGLRRYARVVIPDANRAALLARQLADPPPVIVVRNLPLRSDAPYRPPAAPFSVAYFGPAGPVHAIDRVIESIPLWPAGVDFFQYGRVRDEQKRRLTSLAERLGVAARVHWGGWIDERAFEAQLGRHSLGIALFRPTSDNWRFIAGASNKLYRFMKMGRPQVVSDGAGMREQFADSGVAICVDLEDPAAIAQAVRVYHDDPARCDVEGRRAHALVRDGLNYDTEFAPVMRFLDERIGR